MNAMRSIMLDTTRMTPVSGDQAHSSSLATNCGACPDLCWFVVLPEWHQEQLARLECQKRGAQIFSPMVRVLIPQRNRPAIRQLQPAFPGYLFALISPSAIANLRYARGVAGLLYEVGQTAMPAIVPAPMMSALLARASIQGVLERRDDPTLPAWVVGDEDPKQARRRRQWRALADIAEMAAPDRVALLHDIVGRS